MLLPLLNYTQFTLFLLFPKVYFILSNNLKAKHFRKYATYIQLITLYYHPPVRLGAALHNKGKTLMHGCQGNSGHVY